MTNPHTKNKPTAKKQFKLNISCPTIPTEYYGENSEINNAGVYEKW